jgi:hypothetical protein
MDIKEYVRGIQRPGTGQTEDQFGVLAFDLGLAPSIGHPPPTTGIRFTDEIRANSASGPWCVIPHNWSPVANPRKLDGLVIIKSDRHGQPDVYADKGSYGQRETIHTERSLVARVGIYSEHYVKQHKEPPKSVSLYTYYSPCSHCIAYLKGVPHKSSIPKWFIAYSLPYVKPIEKDERTATDPFETAEAAIAAVKSLHSSGWDVL